MCVYTYELTVPTCIQAAVASTATAVSRVSARPPSLVGLLRLAALDAAVVRARMHQLQKLLPEEHVQQMVRRYSDLSSL